MTKEELKTMNTPLSQTDYKNLKNILILFKLIIFKEPMQCPIITSTWVFTFPIGICLVYLRNTLW